MYYAVMFFYQEPDNGRFVLANTLITNNCAIALETYSNTRCPASQFIKADSREELVSKMNEMEANFKNEEWLEKNLYPCM